MICLHPHADPTRDTNNKERCFIFNLSGQEDVCIVIGSRDTVQKHPRCLCWKPCRYWWKMQCMFPNVWYQYKLWRCCSSVDLCLLPKLTSWSYQLIGASTYPMWSFSTKILTQKGGGDFNFANLNNGSHWVNSRILQCPCFVIWV